MRRKVANIKNGIQNLVGKDTFSFFAQSANYMTSTLLIRGMQFLTIPILTALLTPAEYGILGIYTSIVSIFITVISLNFDSSTVRFFYDKPDEYEDFFKSINLFVTIVGAGMIGLIFLFRERLAQHFGVDSNIVMFATVTPYFNNCYTLFLSTLQAKKQSRKYMRVTLIQRLSALALTILLMYLMKEERYYGKIYAEIIVCMVTFFILFKRFYFGARIKWKYVSYAAKIGIPLIPHVLSSFILSYFARIMINNINGNADAGIFSFAEDIGMVMMIVSMSFNKAWTPVFYDKMNLQDYRGINQQTLKIIKISVLLAVFLLFFAKEMVLVMSNEKYYAALSVVPIIIVGKAFGPLYTIYSHFSDYYKKTLFISIGTLVVGVINIILNSLFIPKYGVMAGAYNTMTCSIMLFICHYIISRMILKVRIIPVWPLLQQYMWLFLAVILYMIGLKYLSAVAFVLVRLLFFFVVSYFLVLKNVIYNYKTNR